MRAIEVFEKLAKLYPDAWGLEQRKEWAQVYADGLRDIEGPELETAYRNCMKNHKFQKPPKVADIRSHLEAKVSGPKKIYDTGSHEQWPYRKFAHETMLQSPACKKAVKDGWGLGLWEFLAKRGRMPNYGEQEHLIETNMLFHRQYAACGTGERILQPTYRGEKKMLPVERIWLSTFETFLKKRQDIIELYGE